MPAQSQQKRRSATQDPDKPAKRTRVSRACDQCRVAREKCDGGQPTCSTCLTSKRGCTYTTNPKKRGIQPGYIRVLELALATLFQQNAENERYLNDRLAREGPSSLLLSRDSKESNKLHKQWRKTRFNRDVDTLLSGGEPSRHDSDPPSPAGDENNSDADEPAPAPTPNENFNESLPYDLITPQSLIQQVSALAEGLGRDALSITLPLDSWKQIENYFTYTQCWLPICEKHDVLKLSYSYPSTGMRLSFDAPDSGSHAELWSILAVASTYELSNSSNSVSHASEGSMTPKQLYDTARSLIPHELGSFDLGHVKALLNLAIFSIAQSLTEAAWFLVGCASRVLENVDQISLIPSTRRMHVFGGCLVLDSMLALQLGRRPYFRQHNIEQLGRIDEDGLEEWQPWSGGSNTAAMQQSRTPLLAFSSFRHLLDVLDILVTSELASPSGLPLQDTVQRLNDWKSTLPPKLDYLQSENAPTPSTPPAVLLQLTYHCTALSLMPTQKWLQRILELLEPSHAKLGLTSLPPVVYCLMGIVKRHSTHFLSDPALRARMQKLQTDIDRTWRKTIPDIRSPPIHSRQSISVMQMPTPDSIQQPLSGTQATVQVNAGNNARTAQNSGSLPDVLGANTNQQIESFINASRSAPPDPRYPDIPGDLESFFDDLASLDNTNKLENQPQFMQNLGFAPDANMADLFSEFIPMQTSAFVGQESADLGHLDHYNFYDTS
ncbi:uncharacterized protein M421DRAFT_89247 [Didymella exigua CBS 183.55]|uniref:Zn(2)-C6 fungal-type domain-containing protein n=1 Tax=Didymella exigua CBS 183.55 TaxID=1150837 RepID=A0A6A5RX02_9PLEO|nr:uncharacterized protein M421DRAFT_89247 [Didymella exigua CBS 183.55]KAF1932931.1 hypothetical protein M421DRAFT_89247 [Didymella exigua CBS 183.55]